MKTYTPTLDASVLDRLRDYANLFADDFPQSRPALWAGVYLQGLLLDGERKSVEPLSRRITLPDGLTSTDPEQALQQFVNQSPWDHLAVLKRYRAHLARTFASPDGIFLFDDVSFPKQGTHSVGVQRQYCGAVGKKANCQVAVSVHYVSPTGHYPLDLQLYLPDSWLTDTKRLDQAGGPRTNVSLEPNTRSLWSCSTGCGARACPAARWWPMPAMGSPACSGPCWSNGR